MNKWLSIGISSVLVIALVATGVLFFQKSSALTTANATIATRDTTISGLNTDLTASRAETTDYKAKLAASEATVLTLNGTITDLNGKNLKLTNDIAAVNTQLSNTQTQLSDTQTELAGTKSSLTSAQSSLSAAQSSNATLTASLKTIKDPRHFASLTELKDWLQKDDTNTKYPTMEGVQKSFILQVRALRDGFLLPVTFYIDSGNLYVINEAVIGNLVYDVSASTDNVVFWTICNAQPSHPEPLP
jgi:septal ring factor EnvC (AmiA/AmiB activator)